MAAIALTAVTLACGGSATPAPAGPAQVDSVKVITGSGVALGQFYSMMLVGVDKGFFKKHNIDPTFTEGTGSATSTQQIATGQFDFGIEIGAAALIATVARGGAVKMVAQDDPVAPVGVLSVPPKLIKTPRDLIGKTIGLPPGTTQANIFPAFLKANNLQATQMNIVNSPLTGIQASLIQGRLDGYVSYAQSNIPILNSLGATGAYAMKFADFGFKLSPDAGIVTTNDIIKSKPDLVKRFVAAIEDSINYTLDGHVTEACASTAKLFPQAIKADVCTNQTRLEVANIKAYRAPGKPITLMSDQGWQEQINALVTYGNVPKVGTTADYYTNQFVPNQK
ncbi:MAG: ABC transporter substrate-binding protein [Candidatus Dormibacteraeota bacterium]|uniref:ABC transporter substrate-binding protein n=1 Tax=Candidatus Dormiibacter inghamiae TaxID=3127013 RepID=A0A934KED7_9BACT|nr:ABC transporter substrate-binding protein [Candidatus Dormibacteraeota bacterium]